MDEEMMLLVSWLAEYLRRSEQQLQCFHKYESQVEGWFTGELFCFLDREIREGRSRLSGFERQAVCHIGGGYIKIDLKLRFHEPDSVAWVELKHWHIGIQNNQLYDCHWYFTTANHSSCVKPDVEKLLRIPEDGDKFMLVLLTKNPGSEGWNSGVEEFNTMFHPLSVHSLTNPSDYPEYFFLGLLHVLEEVQH